jgi:catechol 2,3-dioxygenase-like lactoylglutathione lyase family enzyme
MSRPPIDQQVTFLYTADLTATARFYEEALGLRLVLDQGTCRIYQVTGSAFIGFCQRAGLPSADNRVILTLVSDQVDEWHTHLTGLGIPFEKPPALNPQYNIYHCLLRDPNGYLVEIQRFLDPAWPKF